MFLGGKTLKSSILNHLSSFLNSPDPQNFKNIKISSKIIWTSPIDLWKCPEDVRTLLKVNGCKKKPNKNAPQFLLNFSGYILEYWNMSYFKGGILKVQTHLSKT